MPKIWKTNLEADVSKASAPVEKVEADALHTKEDPRERLQLSRLRKETESAPCDFIKNSVDIWLNQNFDCKEELKGQRRCMGKNCDC